MRKTESSRSNDHDVIWKGALLAFFVVIGFVFAVEGLTDDEPEETEEEEVFIPDMEKFDSGSTRIDISMSNTNLGDVEVIDIPGHTDVVTFCYRGQRVWTGDSEGASPQVLPDPECAESNG